VFLRGSAYYIATAIVAAFIPIEVIFNVLFLQAVRLIMFKRLEPTTTVVSNLPSHSTLAVQ